MTDLKALTLTWRTLPGHTRTLSTGAGITSEIGGCYHLWGRRYRAWASIDGELISHHGGSYRAAMRALEAELDRRSIGLFGVDDLTFTQAARAR